MSEQPVEEFEVGDLADDAEGPDGEPVEVNS